MSTVKMAELSRRSGVSVATLKYYLRSGLLHPGTATAANQALYDESHVHRVRLVRSLVEVGRLSLADTARVLAAVDGDEPMHHAFAVAQDAMVPGRQASDPAFPAALAEVDRFVRRHRLAVRPDAAVRVMLANVLVSLWAVGWRPGGESGPEVDSRLFDPLVPGLLAQAEIEVGSLPTGDRAAQMEHSVVGTIAFEVAQAAVRRMALEHVSARRFGRRPARPAGPARPAW
jgi:DNA-binding transcriptional MerR regulator